MNSCRMQVVWDGTVTGPQRGYLRPDYVHEARPAPAVILEARGPSHLGLADQVLSALARWPAGVDGASVEELAARFRVTRRPIAGALRTLLARGVIVGEGSRMAMRYRVR